eukprot:s3428_g6.t2
MWTSTWAEVAPKRRVQLGARLRHVEPKLDRSCRSWGRRRKLTPSGADVGAMSDRNGAFGRCCADLATCANSHSGVPLEDGAPPAETAPDSWQIATELLAEMKLLGLQYSTRSYAGAGHAFAAPWYLQPMAQEPRCPTSSSYVSAIGSCGQRKEWQEALHLLRDFQQRRCRCDVFIYSSAISACSHQWQVALALLGELQMRHVEGNVVAYGAAIGACEKNSQWQRAIYLLSTLQEQMQSNPNLAPAFTFKSNLFIFGTFMQITYCSALNACARGDEWLLALQIFREAETEGDWKTALVLMNGLESKELQADVITYNAAVSCCEKSRQWQRALNLLRQLQERRLRCSIISYNAAISACVHWHLALSLLREVEGICQCTVITFNAAISGCERLERSQISFNAALSACERGEQWEVALELLREAQQRQLPGDLISDLDEVAMKSHDLSKKANVITYSAAISACEKGSQWQRALMLLGEMDKKQVPANLITYSAAISACGRGEEWQQALQLLAQLTELELRINVMLDGGFAGGLYGEF